MHMFSNEKNDSYDALISMAKIIESQLDKDIYQEIIEASNGVFIRFECAKDFFRFGVNLPSSSTNVLTLYKQIHQPGTDFEHVFYSINGFMTKSFLINEPLTLDVVTGVDGLRKAPNNELYRLNGALERAIRVIKINKSRGGRHD